MHFQDEMTSLIFLQKEEMENVNISLFNLIF